MWTHPTKIEYMTTASFSSSCSPTVVTRAILTEPAIAFLNELARAFEPRRQELLQQRKQRQQKLVAGALPDFLPDTEGIRSREWTVAPIPPDLLDRRVEITAPVEPKMIINALNSGAKVFMADFEDSNSPTWQNCIEGQLHLRDAVRRTLRYVSPDGKAYEIGPAPAVLMVRPRGWHLNEKHFEVDGQARSEEHTSELQSQD